MDGRHASVTLRALIDGVDPRTGEALARDGVLNDPDILRALFLGVEALEGVRAGSKRRIGPANAGNRWSADEDAQLRRLWEAGAAEQDLAARFGRSTLGVRSRLVKFGLLEPSMIQGLIPNAPPRAG